MEGPFFDIRHNPGVVSRGPENAKNRRAPVGALPADLTAGEALEMFAGPPPTRYMARSVVERARRIALETAGRPRGVLSPEEGHRLALLHEDAVKAEMLKICAGSPKDELFFAARMWTPEAIAANGPSLSEGPHPRRGRSRQGASPLSKTIDEGPIPRHWDDIRRVVGSLKLGWVTASPFVGRLEAKPRKSGPAKATQE